MRNNITAMPKMTKMTEGSAALQQMEFENVRPRLILVGSTLRVNEVASHLKPIGLDIVRVKYIKDMKEAVDDQVAGVVYVLPLERSHIISVHRNVMKYKNLRRLPFFVVAPEWISSRREREIYRAGVRMIFEWPRERDSFADLMLQALSHKLRRIKGGDEDKALLGAINNRITAGLAGFEPKVQITVYHGIALLKGEVHSIEFKKKLVEIVKHTPGLRGVVDQSLTVYGGLDNRDVMVEKANEVLEKAYGIPHSTLEVEFDEVTSHLILSGTASTKKQVDEALQRLEQLHGVRQVLNRVKVSAQRHKKDRFLARRAQRLLKKMALSDDHHIEVKVMGGRALLKGEVDNNIEAKHLSRLMGSVDGISGVESHMHVASAH